MKKCYSGLAVARGASHVHPVSCGDYVYKPANGPQSGPAGPLAILPGQLGAALLDNQMDLGAAPYIVLPGSRIEVGPKGGVYETLGAAAEEMLSKIAAPVGVLAIGVWAYAKYNKNEKLARTAGAVSLGALFVEILGRGA